MSNDPFEIQIFSDSRCILRQKRDHTEQEFANVKEALECAQRLAEGEDSKLTVFDENGVRFMRILV